MKKKIIGIEKPSEAIQAIYKELFSHTVSTDEIDLNKYASNWGYKNSEPYNRTLLDFVISIKNLAIKSTLKCYEKTFYYYDGEIYRPVSSKIIEAAYFQLMEYYHIVVMMSNHTIFKDKFLNNIEFYNILSPRADLIGFTNGVLDIRHDQWYDFSPELHVIRCNPYKFDQKARCPKWQHFLKEVLPNKNSRTILQMFMGLGLMERGTVYDTMTKIGTSRIELCLILIGSGSNGKSVIYQTMMGIYGGDKISSMDYDELTAYGDEGMRARKQLRGAIFNWSSDSNPNTFGKKRTGVFKRIVSGEPVSDRGIGEDIRENSHLPYLIFNLNELPYPDDQSLGFIRRLQFVTFDVIIPRGKQNLSLAGELVSEYPGIFNWVRRGMKELKRRMFCFPSAEGERRAVLKTQLKMNPVIAFTNAYNLRPQPNSAHEDGYYISTKDLLSSLEIFCMDNDVPEDKYPSRQLFGQTMNKNNFEKKRSGTGFLYHIYGCNENGLKHNFIIQKESMETSFSHKEEKNEADSELSEED